MLAQLWPLVALVLAGLANIAVQILSYRAMDGRGQLLKSQIAGSVAGLVPLAALSLVGPGAGATPEALGVLAADLLIYGAFCYVYFHWNNMGETARRIRLLRELAEAPGGLSEAALFARYPAREILERRLTRLIDGGQLIERDGCLYLAGGLVLHSARLTGFAKWIVFGGRSELDDFDHITL
jgi:hypothetical protein